MWIYIYVHSYIYIYMCVCACVRVSVSVSLFDLFRCCLSFTYMPMHRFSFNMVAPENVPGGSTLICTLSGNISVQWLINSNNGSGSLKPTLVACRAWYRLASRCAAFTSNLARFFLTMASLEESGLDTLSSKVAIFFEVSLVTTTWCIVYIYMGSPLVAVVTVQVNMILIENNVITQQLSGATPAYHGPPKGAPLGVVVE